MKIRTVFVLVAAAVLLGCQSSSIEKFEKSQIARADSVLGLKVDESIEILGPPMERHPMPEGGESLHYLILLTEVGGHTEKFYTDDTGRIVKWEIIGEGYNSIGTLK